MSGNRFPLIRSAAAVAALAALGAATAAPTSAQEPYTQQQRTSWDPVGAVFTCEGDVLTVEPGGLVTESFHLWTDRQGILRFQDAITFHEVTATDETGQRYAIAGAMTIADKLASWEEPMVATDTTHITIREATGGIRGTVQIVTHFAEHGGQRLMDIGNCAAP